MQLHKQRAELSKLRQLVEGAALHSPMQRAEEAAILRLWRTASHYSAGSKLDSELDVRLITSGWAAWLRYAGDGRRLIFLFLMPGDFIVPGLFGVPGCDLMSLTPLCTVDAASLAADELDAPTSFTKIARSRRTYQLLLLDHLTRLTMGSTTSSLASLLSEFHERLVKSGASVEGRFNFPIGQRVLASALGRSPVQVNKVMTRFQADGILKVGFNWIDVLDPEKLASLTGLTPAKQVHLTVVGNTESPEVFLCQQ